MSWTETWSPQGQGVVIRHEGATALIWPPLMLGLVCLLAAVVGALRTAAGFSAFDRVEIVSGATRDSRFWEPVLRGQPALRLGRFAAERRPDAEALGRAVAAVVGVPLAGAETSSASEPRR